MKKIIALLLALVMILSLSVSAFAAMTEVTETGSILVKNNDTVMASQKTFAAYKILDLKAYIEEDEGEGEGEGEDEAPEIQSYLYTVPASLEDFYAARYGLNKTASDFDAQVVAKIAEETDFFAFGAAVIATATEAPKTGAAVENGYKFTDLPLGYYVIEDTTTQGDFIKPVSALIIDTATPDVEINVKAEKPGVDKKIDTDNNLTSTDDRAENSQAAIGDTITYVITSKVPDMTGYDKYFFIAQDTMSKGLTYNNNMVIKVGDKTLTANDYTVTTTNNENGTTSLKIVFHDFILYNTEEFVGKPITITYTALLNDNAEINKTPNTNEVYLQYSNNPGVDYNGENEPNEEDKEKDPLGETPKEEVKTFTTALEIIKTDPNGNRLEGAVFTLTGETMNRVRVEQESFELNETGEYWKLKDGSYTTTDPNSTIDGAPVDKDKYESLAEKYAKTTNTTYETKVDGPLTITATVGEDGTVRFEGLKEGDYTITEAKAPTGYNPLTETVQVKITWNKETLGFEFTGAADADGIAQVTVVNQTGTELPSTGGMGTTIFYILGGIMVLAAVVMLVTKKRMSSAE